MAKLGQGEDPLRRRNTCDYRIQGAWSVRLRPGGFHRDHFHPEGWLSSAFYVETPDAALDSPDKQGWIRFGKPPFLTSPPMEPARFVRPKPGRLVLFPSYMWHGTVPFTTDEAPDDHRLRRRSEIAQTSPATGLAAALFGNTAASSAARSTPICSARIPLKSPRMSSVGATSRFS